MKLGTSRPSCCPDLRLVTVLHSICRHSGSTQGAPMLLSGMEIALVAASCCSVPAFSILSRAGVSSRPAAVSAAVRSGTEVQSSTLGASGAMEKASDMQKSSVVSVAAPAGVVVDDSVAFVEVSAEEEDEVTFGEVS